MTLPNQKFNYVQIYEGFILTRVVIPLIVALSVATQAEEIIVEATRLSEERIDPSRSNSVITESEILLKKPQTVADILRGIPGVEVVRQGNAGQTTSVFIRGARSEDTLVLIDGMEANEAMSPAAGFDFSGLSPENIQRIEIYNGPQSARFGAGALGGVINIVTKSGGETQRSRYLMEAGSFQTNRFSLSNSGTVKKVRYSLGAETISTQGFSAAQGKHNEADGTQFASGSAKLNFELDSNSKLEGTVRYNDAKVEIDTQGGLAGDDPNNQIHSKQLFSGIMGNRRFMDGRVDSSLGFYFSETKRDGRNKPHGAGTIDSSDHFLSENLKIESNHEVLLGNDHTIRFGLQWRQESGRSHSLFNGTPSGVPRKNQSIMGESMTYLFDNEVWFSDLGFRADQSSVISATIWSKRASFGRYFNHQKTKTYVTYGTGFKLPSLYQLYSVYGDSSLREENSRTIEATIEQELVEIISANLSIFENRYSDLIDFNTATNKYFNVSKANAKGAELEVTIQGSPQIFVKLNYSLLKSIDETTGLKLLRRPNYTNSATVEYRNPKWDGYFQYRFKGERDDVDPSTFSRIKNPSYETINVGGSYAFAENMRLNGRIENLFNLGYSEVAGYSTPRLSFYIGISGQL